MRLRDGRLWVLALGLAALLASCSDSGDKATDPGGGPSNEEVSFAADVQPILSGSCAVSDCHAGASPAQGLDLSAGASYAALVGVQAAQRPDLQRVHPGEPDSSYLVLKIEGGQGISRMPPGGALQAEQIATIRSWIEEGADDN